MAYDGNYEKILTQHCTYLKQLRTDIEEMRQYVLDDVPSKRNAILNPLVHSAKGHLDSIISVYLTARNGLSVIDNEVSMNDVLSSELERAVAETKATKEETNAMKNAGEKI